jgi:hypothetical protein
MPYWIASFTMPTASNSAAIAYVETYPEKLDTPPK